MFYVLSPSRYFNMSMDNKGSTNKETHVHTPRGGYRVIEIPNFGAKIIQVTYYDKNGRKIIDRARWSLVRRFYHWLRIKFDDWFGWRYDG